MAEISAPRRSASSGPTAGEAVAWRKIEVDERTPYKPDSAFILCTATYDLNGDDASAAGQQCRRRRRCYSETERAQVAETRRRHACDGCRASKTKCHHANQQGPTDQYQMETHEEFALGLTNPSTKENKHGHKKVMKKTIAAIDHKLVGGQNGSDGQEPVTKQASTHKADLATAVPSSKALAAKGRSSQQRKTPAHVHQVQKSAATSKGPPPGVNKPFRVSDGQSPKQRRSKKQKTSVSSSPGNKSRSSPHDGRQTLTATMTSPPMSNQRSPINMSKPSSRDGPIILNVKTLGPNLGIRPDGIPVMISEDAQFTEVAAIFPRSNNRPKARNEDPLEVIPPRYHREPSSTSDQESITAGTEESIFSSTWSPSSWTSEFPPPFVHMSQVELEAPATLSFTKLLNVEWDKDTLASYGMNTGVSAAQMAERSLSETGLSLGYVHPAYYGN